VAQEQKDPVAISAIAQFKKALAAAKDVKHALADPRIQAALLPAVGLATSWAIPAWCSRRWWPIPASPTMSPARSAAAG
jgi:uncharacterized membrane protein